jgi:uncharacterized membrane protein YesL
MYHTITNGVYRFCEWVTRLAYLNLLWIAFTLVGLIIFGVGPATIAMYTVTRKWLTESPDIPIFKTFFEAYKKEFRKGNVLGIILFSIGAILYVDFMVLDLLSQETSILKVIFSSLFVVFVMMLLYIFPVFVHYDIPLSKNFKYALIIGFTRPLYSLGMIIGALGAITISLLHITIIIFFSGSFFALVMTAFALRAFKSLGNSKTTNILTDNHYN